MILFFRFPARKPFFPNRNQKGREQFKGKSDRSLCFPFHPMMFNEYRIIPDGGFFILLTGQKFRGWALL